MTRRHASFHAPLSSSSRIVRRSDNEEQALSKRHETETMRPRYTSQQEPKRHKLYCQGLRNDMSSRAFDDQYDQITRARSVRAMSVLAPNNRTMNYPSTHFVESAGTVLFHLSTRQICLVRHIPSNEYLLPKGRRNLGESRHDAAVRETREETGWMCQLPPVKMWTRCTPAASEQEGQVEDVPRLVDGVVEPFTLTQRTLPAEKGTGVKIIWWFVGVVEEAVERGEGEEKFEAELLSFEAAVDRLTFSADKEVVRQAIDIFHATFHDG